MQILPLSSSVKKKGGKKRQKVGSNCGKKLEKKRLDKKILKNWKKTKTTMKKMKKWKKEESYSLVRFQ